MVELLDDRGNVIADGEGQDVKSRIVLNDGKTDNTMFMYGSE